MISHTPEPEKVIAASIKACHSKKLKGPEAFSQKDILRLIDMVRTSGHWSVMEHASFTFSVSGVSRVTTHQLVRHRIASYSQQSQRYVDISDGGFVTPSSLEDGKEGEIYRKHIKNAIEAYSKLTDMGVPKEDARYILPNAMTSNLVFTMNARALWNFISLRTCRRAQQEIRILAIQMLRLVREKAPAVFRDAGPPCLRGPCPEGKHSCGRPVTREEL